MSTTTTGNTTADRQRQRASRGIGRSAGPSNKLPAPPRQRRPALAALAVLLIVGGALLAGLLAIRMDSRVPVLAARADIAAGTQIQRSDLIEVQVASESLGLVAGEDAGLLVGQYATTRILPNQLMTPQMVAAEGPIDDGESAIVSVLLNPGLSPESTLEVGDKVMVIRVSTDTGGEPQSLSEALVLGRAKGAKDDFGAGGAGELTLLVPVEAAESVVDASGNNKAGIALLSRGNSVDDVSLEVAD